MKSGDGSSDLDGTSDDVDLEGDGFGFIEIGNTRVKFYVLNYDAMAQEGGCFEIKKFIIFFRSLREFKQITFNC